AIEALLALRAPTMDRGEPAGSDARRASEAGVFMAPPFRFGARPPSIRQRPGPRRPLTARSPRRAPSDTAPRGTQRPRRSRREAPRAGLAVSRSPEHPVVAACLSLLEPPRATLRDVRSGRPRASVEIYRGSHRWRSNEGGVRRTKWRVVLSLCEEKVAGMYRTGDERSMFGEKMLTPGPGIACTHEQVQCRATVPNAGCATPCPPVQPTLLRRPCSRAPVVWQRSERVL